jgi:hypothetical protein
MAKEKTKKEWRTFDGQVVPEVAISPFDKKKEPKFEVMLKKVQAAIKARDEADKYLREVGDALIKELYKNRGYDKAEVTEDSYTLYNYDKSIRLSAQKNSVMQITSDINIASKLFDEYLDKVLTTENNDIRKLVKSAFSTRNGEIDPKRLIGLMNLKIEHPKWQEAVKVLHESISTNNTKRYFKLAVRTEEGDYKNLNY